MASVASPVPAAPAEAPDRPPRPKGRPRSARRSAAVLAATLEELVSRGVGGLTIEAVAARAGVSKVTIYRRWPDKVALVLAALETLPELEVPDTGDLVEDMRALRRALVHVVDTSRMADVLPALVAERRRSGHDDAISRYIAQRSAPFRTIVARAVERGEIEPALPLDLVAHLFSSPLGMSLLTLDAPLDDAEWTTIVRTIVDGLRARR